MEATVAAAFSQQRPRFHKLDRDVLVPLGSQFWLPYAEPDVLLAN